MSSEAQPATYVTVNNTTNYYLPNATYHQTCNALDRADFQDFNEFARTQVAQGHRQGVMVSVLVSTGPVGLVSLGDNMPTIGGSRHYWLPDQDYKTTIATLTKACFEKLDRVDDLHK